MIIKRSNKPEKNTFHFLFLCPKYHLSKQCLAGRCLQKESDSAIRFFRSLRHCSVASRAWEQSLLPDAVPVCSWTDIKVLAARQARLFTGTGQPCNLITAVMNTLNWTAYYGSALKGEAVSLSVSVCIFKLTALV